jgi:circadian clock protein KaiB
VKTNKISRAPREITSGSRPSATGRGISQGAAQAFEKSLATRLTGKYVLRLFVAGATARSRQAVLRVRQLCEAELKDNYDLEVIDIYQQPNLARDNQIVATPTLIKKIPPPVRRFIGNLLNIAGLFVSPCEILRLVAPGEAARAISRGELDLIAKGKIAL